MVRYRCISAIVILVMFGVANARGGGGSGVGKHVHHLHQDCIQTASKQDRIIACAIRRRRSLANRVVPLKKGCQLSHHECEA